MKVKITYLPGEEKCARNVAAFLRGFLHNQGAKVKERCERPPYRHIYITSKPPKCSSDTVES